MHSFWSQSIELDSDTETLRRVNVQKSVTKNATFSYDLTSPRDWLEYLQENSGEKQHAIEGGVYTVLRCEYFPSRSSIDKWRVCGESYNMRRLCSSYQKLVDLYGSQNELLRTPSGNAKESPDSDKKAALEDATKMSRRILMSLLEDAEEQLSSRVRSASEGFEAMNSAFIIMITLFWETTSDPWDIVVRGHACTNGQATCTREYDPDPITTVVAIPPRDVASLPNRHEHSPKAKLSSWCRRRRPIETAYKINGVGEVLLVRRHDQEEITQEFEILEGLTSNFFALYPDRKLRTAGDGVLEGYARKLVIASADRCGLTVEYGPVLLTDAKLWEETFVTSSGRLIMPIEKILVPNNLPGERTELQELWSSSPEGHEKQKWRMLYEEMLKVEDV